MLKTRRQDLRKRRKSLKKEDKQSKIWIVFCSFGFEKKTRQERRRQDKQTDKQTKGEREGCKGEGKRKEKDAKI